MAETPFISSSFLRSMFSIATIVGGVLYIENKTTSSIEKAIDKAMSPVNIKIDAHETRLTGLEQKGILNEYKWNIYEDQIKEFIKPEEISRKRAR